MSENSTKIGFKEKTPDDIILKIVEMVEAGDKTQKQIAEEVGVSSMTVYNYAKQFGLTRKYSKTKKKTKKIKKETKEIEPSKITETRKLIEVGLIGARHDMPVDRYIFGDIPNNMMFSYVSMDRNVTKFILDNITFVKGYNGDKVGKETLIVYVTGLSSAQASVIKMCGTLKVNLIFMHYNNSNKEYIPQVIWNHFNTNKIWDVFPSSSSIKMYKYNYTGVDESIYYINIIDFDSKNKFMRDNDTIICGNNIDAYDQFGESVKDILINRDHKKSIFMYKADIKNGAILNSEKIEQISNFSTK